MAACVDDPKPLERLTPVGCEDEATVETQQPEAPPVAWRDDDGHSATVRQQPAARGVEGVERMRARGVRCADLDDNRVGVVRRLRELVTARNEYDCLHAYGIPYQGAC